jgi:hypothetical protein
MSRHHTWVCLTKLSKGASDQRTRIQNYAAAHSRVPTFNSNHKTSVILTFNGPATSVEAANFQQFTAQRFRAISIIVLPKLFMIRNDGLSTQREADVHLATNAATPITMSSPVLLSFPRTRARRFFRNSAHWARLAYGCRARRHDVTLR